MDTIAQAIDMEKLRKDIDANKALLIAQMELALIEAGAYVNEDMAGDRYAYIGTKQVCEVGAVLLGLSHPDFEKLRLLVDITSDRYLKRMRELFDIGVVMAPNKAARTEDLFAGGAFIGSTDAVVDADDATYEKMKATAVEMVEGSRNNDKQLFQEYVAAMLAVSRPKFTDARTLHATKVIRTYIQDVCDGFLKNEKL